MTVEYFFTWGWPTLTNFLFCILATWSSASRKKISPLMWTEIALSLMKWSHRNSVAELLLTIFFSFIEIINYYLYNSTCLLFLWCFNELTENHVLISNTSRRRPWAREQHFFLVDSWVSFPYLIWSICRCACKFTRFGNVYCELLASEYLSQLFFSEWNNYATNNIIKV